MFTFSKKAEAPLQSVLKSGLLALCIFVVVSASQPRIWAGPLPQSTKAQSATTQAPDSTPVTQNQAATKSDRSSLPLSKALLGHWISADEKNHFYYGAGYYISVYSGKFYPGQYIITDIDENERKLRLHIKATHFRNLTFSPDRNELSDVAEIAGMKAEEAFKWRYIDDSQKPTAEVIKSTETGEETLEAVSVEERPQFIIGDLKSKTYYWYGCPAYETLPAQRKVYFKTREDARRAGYRPAKDCP